MSEIIALLILFVASAAAMWFLWNHLERKIRTQSTTDATGSCVSREDNPELYRFHVIQCAIALVLLGLVGIASVIAVLVELFSLL